MCGVACCDCRRAGNVFVLNIKGAFGWRSKVDLE